MIKVGLLDPSLRDNNGTISTNIGDVIIYDAVIKVLDDVFKNYDLIRVSTHSNPDRKLLRNLSHCDVQIIGGTNLFSSDIKSYNQWKFERKLIDKLLFPIKNIVSLGVGWWQYQSTPTVYTTNYYKKSLSSHFNHSVRDSYTEEKMCEMGFYNVINTSCPTLWNLSGIALNRKTTKKQDCVFTLTDYKPLVDTDSRLLEKLLENFSGKLYFFVQGLKDIEYINSLGIYTKNKSRFDFLSTLEEYNSVLKNDVLFVGTRLHAGARALQNKIETFIFEVDNRTTEIRKDTNFPSVERGNFEALQRWLDGEKVFSLMKINEEKIKLWRNQFANL